jgi:hypothetical protein
MVLLFIFLYVSTKMRDIFNITFIFFLSLILCNAQVTICEPDSTLCYSKKKFDADFSIQMEKKLESNKDVAQYQTPIAFDTDNDCVPEIVTAGFEKL